MEDYYNLFFSIPTVQKICFEDYHVGVVADPVRIINTRDNTEKMQVIAEYINEQRKPTLSRGMAEKFTRENMFNQISNSSYMIFVFYKNELVGNVYSRAVKSFNCHHIYGLFVIPHFQRHGIGYMLIQELMSAAKAEIYTFATQTPVSYALINKFCSIIYPSESQLSLPREYRDIAKRATAIMLNSNYDPATSIMHNHHSYCTFDTMPLSSDDAINNMFQEKLYKGKLTTRDCFFCLGLTK